MPAHCADCITNQCGRRSTPFPPHLCRQPSNDSSRSDSPTNTPYVTAQKETDHPGTNTLCETIAEDKDRVQTMTRLEGSNFELARWMIATDFTRRMRDAICANQRYGRKISTYMRPVSENIQVLIDLKDEAQAFVEENLFEHRLADDEQSLNPAPSPEPAPVPNPELVELPLSPLVSPDPNDSWHCNFNECGHCQGICGHCSLGEDHRQGSCLSPAGPQLIEGNTWLCPVCLIDNSHHADECTNCSGKCRSCGEQHQEMHCHLPRSREYTDFRLIRPEVLSKEADVPYHVAESVYNLIRRNEEPVRLEEFNNLWEQVS